MKVYASWKLLKRLKGEIRITAYIENKLEHQHEQGNPRVTSFLYITSDSGGVFGQGRSVMVESMDKRYIPITQADGLDGSTSSWALTHVYWPKKKTE